MSNSEHSDLKEGHRCVICKTGRLEPGTTTITLQRDNSTVVIQDVPALVCDTCGEGYTDGEVTDRVLEIGDRAIAQGVRFDVRRYVSQSEEAEFTS